MANDDNLFGYHQELLKLLREILTEVRLLRSDLDLGRRDLVSKAPPSPRKTQPLVPQSASPCVASPQTSPSRSSHKDAVSDKMYRAKAPELLKVLLREGVRTKGKRVPELATEIGVSPDTVRRVAHRLMNEENFIRIVPNSGMGGIGTLIQITNRRYEEVERWVTNMTSGANHGQS
jgi:hypothetical protein